jgi:hypothetical protein
VLARNLSGAILGELELRARGHGLAALRTDASLNAEAFGRRHGFEVECRGGHRLQGGRQRACVHMRKRLGA